MKLLSPSAHGVIDYLVVVALLIVPSLFDFSSTAATLTYLLAIVHLLVSLFTRYPLGLVQRIPFPVHGYYELITALVLVPLPWLFAFAGDDAGRNFFVISGIALFLVWLVTNYRAVPADAAYEMGHRPTPHVR